MKIEKSKYSSKFKRFINLLKDKQTIKKARITYQVLWNLALIFMIVVVLGVFFAGGLGAGYFASLVKNEPIRSYDNMKKNIYNYEETSKLYFANDVYLGKLYTDLEREEVKLKDVSQDLINAVVATEDEYFYEHGGVVPKAILRAIFQEVTNSSVQTGGSTLTQQLIKNQILTNEVSFERKAKEILLALRLEKFFSKEEILEAYLNVSTFGRNSSGRNIAGVQSAAKGIFGKDVSDLNLPQAAFIAGLPQSPFGYTPYTNGGEIKQNLNPGISRMKTVLNRMYTDGKISKQQYEEALAYDITKDFITIHENPVEQYPWVTFEIEKRATEVMSYVLAEKDGITKDKLDGDAVLKEKYLALADRDIRQNGYEIHSTINKDIYDRFTEVVNNFQYYGSDKSKTYTDPETGEVKTVSDPVETGAILIENKTGRIISFVGGRDYHREQINHATSAKRSNGSTMKPLLVYAPAFEQGTISPGSILPDVPLRLNPGSSRPWPTNYGGGTHGLVTAREALTRSYNIPAVKAYVDIIDTKPAQYLEKMGFTSLTEGDYVNRSAALGGLTNGVSVEENTNAYGTFANSGQFIDAYMIEKITDKEGNIIFQHEVNPVPVFSPQTAYLTYDLLRDVISGGTATSLNGRLKFSSDWAGKTGTGQDYKDSWFVATNPNVSFGVWNGYDEPKPLELSYKGLSYGVRNIYLWADLMNAAYDIAPELVDPSERQPMPEGIVTRTFCAVSGGLATEACANAGLVRTDLFNAKFVPTKSDHSFDSGKFVTIGGKKYLALDSTPAEFVQTGVILDSAAIQKMLGISANQLASYSNGLANAIVPSSSLQDNGSPPSAPGIAVSGNTITWGGSSEYDIVGYRVYNGGSRVGTIQVDGSYSFQAGTGTYYVTAVDIAGNESAPSNSVTVGQPPATPVDSEAPDDGTNTETQPPATPPNEPETGEQGTETPPVQ
ncbi:transglycosylase domain-containing protein [Bacillus tuaregi]|uniref:transglycosylase domain-containing protein n=1 Tax=Bacillus tuaregi TaxID=1816695 RepID=UPI0008F87FF8|nr:transglycosylase domain-containing protein [Bacillus tuaregi]